ncbi:hypothetical protein [Bdellovibrio sp. HCB288]|uniref:hypothetical protein n=1 Tax=Bdellovibrio sp. HCB288 TaxID=3394355 RepID=UPI0039B47443
MKLLATTISILSITLAAHAEKEKTQIPFKSDFGNYEITGCAGQTFQLDCKLKSVSIDSVQNAETVNFTFKSEDGKVVNNNIEVMANDKFTSEDDVSVLSVAKRKNPSNWSEESQEITLDKSDAKQWTLTFAVVRENLGKSVKRQIEYKVKKK